MRQIKESVGKEALIRPLILHVKRTINGLDKNH